MSTDPRTRIVIADGTKFVHETDERFDRNLTFDYNGSWAADLMQNVSSSFSWGGQLYEENSWSLEGTDGEFAADDKVATDRLHGGRFDAHSAQTWNRKLGQELIGSQGQLADDQLGDGGDLAGVELGEQPIALFEHLGQDFEWKLFEHDRPSDLKERLEGHGFLVEEAEAIMVLDLAEAPLVLWQPVDGGRIDVPRGRDAARAAGATGSTAVGSAASISRPTAASASRTLPAPCAKMKPTVAPSIKASAPATTEATLTFSTSSRVIPAVA